MAAEEPRVGVYICHCGGNISDAVDVTKVREEVARLKSVKVVQTLEYACSDPGQAMIITGIKEQSLNRIVVASCSPRMHLDTFRRTLKSAGLNPYFLEMANIREQVSWVHEDIEQATLKAVDLVRGAVARACNLEPLEASDVRVNKNVVVIGGGVAGIMASIELADKGYYVFLVERSPSIGGHMAQLSKTYPTLDCSQCILTPKMVYAFQHQNITVISLAEVAAVEGSPGNFRVLITKHPRFVGSNCSACGECAKICPVNVPSEFEAGLIPRKAIYSPFKQAVPKTYTIDKENCLYFTKGVCRICEKFCKAKAVNFGQKEETLELDAGAVVACTGFGQVDPAAFGEFSFGLHPNIVTNLQFERLMLQGMHRPSDGKPPTKVAFLLCVGSRMMNKNRGVKYCCKIGCMAAIKQAMLLQKTLPNVEAWIFYQDMRADGKGYEEFYATAMDHNVRFIRGRVAEVVPSDDSDNQVTVRAEDTFLGTQVQGNFDLVVLSLAFIPSLGSQDLARKLGIQIGADGFFLERHFKLRPVDSQREGIFVCGCALSPKDVRETALEAMATASRVATFVGKGEISVSPEVAHIVREKCNACELCMKFCPVGAAEKTSTGITINPVSCTGCGICVPRCPLQAIKLNHCTDEQLTALIQGVCGGGKPQKILAFVERETAYGAIDLAGQNRQTYSSNIEIIGVPSTGRVGLKQVLQAFADGADGVAFVEDHGGVFKEEALRDQLTQIKNELRQFDIEPLRLASISTTLPEYHKVLSMFETLTGRLAKIGPVPSEKRLKIRESMETTDKK